MKKLVRDMIPEQISAAPGSEMAFRHSMNDTEYRDLLKGKLVEEALEFAESENVEELADVLEVLDAILTAMNLDRGSITALQQQKRASKGGFTGRIVLETPGTPDAVGPCPPRAESIDPRPSDSDRANRRPQDTARRQPPTAMTRFQQTLMENTQMNRSRDLLTPRIGIQLECDA